ncbi:MAG: amidohydrolase [Planctomycetota bacterium]
MTIPTSLVQQQTQLRHDLHRHPEVAGDESWTAGRIAEFLLSHRPDRLFTGVGGHGVMALFGRRGGRTVLVRCELDALPMEDNIVSDHRSEVECVGHKCGHDGHMAIVSGLAPLLADDRPTDGCVALVFQPAEEVGTGAQAMLFDHSMAQIEPAACFALHNLPGWPVGQVLVRKNTFAMASTGLAARLYGRSSHAAHPEDGNSPFEALHEIGHRLKELPGTLPDGHFALVTLVHMKLGELRYGTLPGDGEIHATIRCARDEDLEQIITAARELVRDIATREGFGCDVTQCDSFASTVNDDSLVDMVVGAATDARMSVHTCDQPFRWSDDFGQFTRQFPGAYFGLGAGEDHPQLHTSDYDFPDVLIAPGIELLHTVARRALVE